MPQRSQIELLPSEIRQELERRLKEKAFSGYRELSEWLAGKGYQISKSAIHKFGQQFQQRLEMVRAATEQALAMKALLPDQEAAVPEAALQLAQSLLFNLMLERGEELPPRELAAIARAIAEASRGSLLVRRFQQEIREKLENLEKEAATGKRKIDPETLRIVREEIYGLAA